MAKTKSPSKSPIKTSPKAAPKAAPNEAPQIVAKVVPKTEIYPKIGLALGSGAAKAITQFGLLQKLIDNNIKISYVMGSSMGAILGGVFALGLDLETVIEKCVRYAEATNINNISNLNIFHESVFKKDYTHNMLKEIFADFTFEECKIPFAVTAVDLETGKEVILNKGLLVDAIRASTSIPGIFEPVFISNQYLVDGGLLEDCPMTSLRKFGQCDLIIGSAISDNKSRQFISGYIYQKFYAKPKKGRFGFLQNRLGDIKNNLSLLTGIISRSVDILRDELFNYKLAEGRPDLLVQINTEKVGLFDFGKTRELIKVGAKAMEAKMPELLALIEKKKKELNG